ncbi:MAG: hypothetical protein IIC51_05670 [Planctomycetes bacterium]|nr:hypothetical protein [Planctomycetota bacterium]
MILSPVHFVVGCVAAILSGISPCRTTTESLGITARAVVEALPLDLRPVFVSRTDEFLAAAHAARATAGGRNARKGNSHFIALDVPIDATGTTDNPSLHFPRTKSKARKLFAERGIEDGGRLPWALEDNYRQLVKAFRTGDAEMVVRVSGPVLHFAIDASMPFSTTIDADGRRTLNPIWEKKRESHPINAHRTARHRCQIELVRRTSQRLAFEVRLWPPRVRQRSDPTAAIWQTLDAAHESLSTLLTIDRDLLRQLEIRTSDDFLAMSDRYYERLAERAGPILETRIESAALLAAELITAAWIEAGRPRLSEQSDRMNEVVDADKTDGPVETAFVGSRSSLVFHRRTCPHVKRIRPENLVSMSTVEEAIKAGRKPCKTCSPHMPP